MNDYDMEGLARSSRRAAVATTFGVFIVLLSLVYSAFKITATERIVQEKQMRLSDVESELKKQTAIINALNRNVASLTNMQIGLFDFLE